MTSYRFTLRTVAAAGLLALLSACGGGNDPIIVNTPPTTTPPPGVTPSAQFAADYGNGVGALNTYAGLTNAGFLDTIDDGFLDAGYTKDQVRSQLAQEAAARIATPSLVFPGVTLSNVTIGACDAAGVCTMTATATNADADTVATTFTTRVKLTANKYRLYGDQTQAPTV